MKGSLKTNQLVQLEHLAAQVLDRLAAEQPVAKTHLIEMEVLEVEVLALALEAEVPVLVAAVEELQPPVGQAGQALLGGLCPRSG